MVHYKIIVDGYAFPDGDGWKVSPNVVLLEENGRRILVDPGANQDLLEQALHKEQLQPGDIDLLYFTHTHLDHILNLRMFPQHPMMEFYFLYEKDKITKIRGSYIPGTTIKMIPTPGHCVEHTSLLFDSENGRTCIAGDLFWWINDAPVPIEPEVMIELKDTFAYDIDVLKVSRKKILDQTDYLIPGHGIPVNIVKT